ncbi:MAG: hypothetical protein P8R54_17660 [Myxococcota bacterium]|nr:hypothetical protein [Myxococcota bacterium]
MASLSDVLRPRQLLASIGLLPLSAQAAPGEFQLVRTTEDCQTYMGARDADGVTPVRIECRWDGIEKASVEAMFDQFDRYHEFVWALGDSRIERTEPNRALVWQRHEVPGTAPRETLVWLLAEDNGFGSRRYTWTTAPEEELTLSASAVRAPRNDGMWNIIPGDSGVDVVLELSYDPGGMVPDWLVKWCQTLGADRMMSEIQGIAASGGVL